MSRKIDIQALINTKIGKLTIIDIYPYRYKDRNSFMAHVKCDCGTQKDIPLRYLTGSGRKVLSCGCSKFVNSVKGVTLLYPKLYNVYYSMLSRCYNKNHQAYEHYGKRGIGVWCKWRTDFSYFLEWALSSGYKEGLSIDRINVNDGYYPYNCRWVDMTVQGRNKRNTIKVNYNGEELALVDLAESLHMSPQLLYQRVVGQNLPVNIAIERPLYSRGGRKGYIKKNSVDPHVKKDAHPLTYKGRTQSLYYWCKELGLEYTPTYKRWHRGWSPEKLFETPIEHRRNNDRSETKGTQEVSNG